MEGHQRAIMGQMTVEGIESNVYITLETKIYKSKLLFDSR